MTAAAYVSWGRWVADCPRNGCPNAERYGPDPVTKVVGGLTGTRFTCNFCGLTTTADWPPNVDDIDALLALRPVPSTRNWRPPETIHDLADENMRHFIIAPTERLQIVGDRIVTGRERLLRAQRELRAIEGNR